MWFLDSIVSWLDSVTGRFLDAYYEVSGWVFPFYYLATPLYYLYEAFYNITFYFGQFNNWLDWAAGRIDVILGTFDIWSYFQDWFNMAQNAWDWVYNAVWNVWNIINDWWSSAQLTVLAWIDEAKSYADSLVAGVETWLASLQSAWDDFRTTTLPNLVDSFDVDSLIRSWFTIYTPFWEGWQELRDQVVEFFTDPLQWLYNKMDEWFERFW